MVAAVIGAPGRKGTLVGHTGQCQLALDAMGQAAGGKRTQMLDQLYVKERRISAGEDRTISVG